MTTIASTATLLAEVFPGTRVSRPDYLRWLYEDSPFGVAIEANLDDELGRAGHYAVVPITLVQDGTPLDGALSLNTAVHERARGRGTFVRLAEETYTQARLQRVRMILGVGNANSTHGLVHRLGFEFVTALPATILLPIPGPRVAVRSAWAEPAAFGESGIAADIGALLVPSKRGIARIWTPETLRWRLSDPGMRYGLHRTSDALVVSCRDQRYGVGVAILLKVFATTEISPMVCSALVRAVCRFHRAPVALHVGINGFANFRGFSLPKRLRERPLNLVYKSLDDGSRHSPIACFEFLDFDAY